MKLSDSDFLKLKQLEEELWLAETRFNRQYMEKIFASDLFEYGSGVCQECWHPLLNN